MAFNPHANSFEDPWTFQPYDDNFNLNTFDTLSVPSPNYIFGLDEEDDEKNKGKEEETDTVYRKEEEEKYHKNWAGGKVYTGHINKYGPNGVFGQKCPRQRSDIFYATGADKELEQSDSEKTESESVMAETSEECESESSEESESKKYQPSQASIDEYESLQCMNMNDNGTESESESARQSESESKNSEVGVQVPVPSDILKDYNEVLEDVDFENNDGRFFCLVCDSYSCASKAIIKCHVLSHSDKQKFPCQGPGCGKVHKWINFWWTCKACGYRNI